MFRRKISTVIFGIIIAYSICSEALANDWQFYAQKGLEANDAKNYIKAESLFKQGLTEARKIKDIKGEVFSLTSLADVFLKQQKYSDAEIYFKQGIKIIEVNIKLPQADLVKADLQRGLAKAYLQQQKYAQAEPFLRQALEVYEKYPSTQELNIADVSGYLYNINIAKKNYAEAQACLQKTLTICKKRLGASNPKTVEIQKSYDLLVKGLEQYNNTKKANLYLQQGIDARQANNFKTAEDFYLKAIQEYKNSNYSDKNYISTLNNLGCIYLETSKLDEANKTFEELDFQAKKLFGEQSNEYLTILNNTGFIFLEMAIWNKAELSLNKAISIEENQIPVPYEQNIISLSALGELYRQTNQLEKAEKTFQKAIKVSENNKGFNNSKLSMAKNGLALIYDYKERFNEAVPLFEDAINIAEKYNDQVNLTRFLNNLAELYRKTKQYDKAEKYYSQSLEITVKNIGENTTAYAATIDNLALLYLQQEKYEQAETYAQKSKNIYERLLPINHPELGTAAKILAMAEIERKKFDEADINLKQAKNIFINNFGENYPQLKEINYWNNRLSEKRRK